VFMKAERMIEL